MNVYEEALGRAARDGVISEPQVQQLLPYFAAPTVAVETKKSAGLLLELSTPLASEPGNWVEDSEMPRFVRGFHDILITIGMLIGLAGVWGLGTVYAAVPVILVLAEILVRRQRLALPAVVLTVLLAVASVMILYTHLTTANGDGEIRNRFGNQELNAFFYLFAMLFVFGLFYWRYKVPLALAAGIFTGAATILASVFLILSVALHQTDFLQQSPRTAIVMFFLTAVAIFLRALFMDMLDPGRTTRRSDVAFWLHLVAAPSLLYSTLALVFISDPTHLWMTSDMGFGRAIAVLVVVIGFMKIGLLLDRRAFVTSGLLSLGYAIWTLFEKSELSTDNLFFYVLITIGVLVLALGIGWPHIRRFMFGFLPDTIKTKLPPLR